MKPSADSTIEARPLTGRVGAVVTGVTLSAELSDRVVSIIRDAVLKHKVIFFRGQTHLDDAEQRAFSALLGDPIPHPTTPAEATQVDEVFEVDSEKGRATSWHSDVTFVANYPAFSILRPLYLPPVGGDTMWANTATAYTHLPAPLRILADEMWAIHTNQYDYAAAARARNNTAQEQAYRASFEAVTFATEHPVVRVHPETGEKCLLIGGFAQKLKGLSTMDSVALQEIYQRHVTRPDNTVRWSWSAGDLAIWDNRATQHVGVDDYGKAPRKLNRISLAGDVPVSVHGEKSVILSGRDSGWYARTLDSSSSAMSGHAGAFERS